MRDEKTRCQHGVWLGDHCYSCESVAPPQAAPDFAEELRSHSLVPESVPESRVDSPFSRGVAPQAEAPTPTLKTLDEIADKWADWVPEVAIFKEAREGHKRNVRAGIMGALEELLGRPELFAHPSEIEEVEAEAPTPIVGQVGEIFVTDYPKTAAEILKRVEAEAPRGDHKPCVCELCDGDGCGICYPAPVLEANSAPSVDVEGLADPGTSEAIELGCTCPKTANQPAARRHLPESDWMCVVKNCPVHGWQSHTKGIA